MLVNVTRGASPGQRVTKLPGNLSRHFTQRALGKLLKVLKVDAKSVDNAFQSREMVVEMSRRFTAFHRYFRTAHTRVAAKLETSTAHGEVAAVNSNRFSEGNQITAARRAGKKENEPGVAH